MTGVADLTAQYIAEELGIDRATVKIAIGCVGLSGGYTDETRDLAKKLVTCGLAEKCTGVPLDVDELEDALDEAEAQAEEET